VKRIREKESARKHLIRFTVTVDDFITIRYEWRAQDGPPRCPVEILPGLSLTTAVAMDERFSFAFDLARKYGVDEQNSDYHFDSANQIWWTMSRWRRRVSLRFTERAFRAYKEPTLFEVEEGR
jgi:hypothetical protein